MTNDFTWLLLIIFGYLCGSIMFCDLIASHFSKKDLYKVSKDGNPGAANVFWYCGWKLGLLGLILDILKGFVPVFLAAQVMGMHSVTFSLAMLAPVLGHAFPAGKLKRGGKCISTSYGVLAALLPYSPAVFILAALNILFSYIAKIKIGNIRALVMYSLFSVIMIPFCLQAQLGAVALGCILISGIVISRHLPLVAPETRSAKLPKIARKVKGVK